MKRLLNYFIHGLILTVPIGLTIYIIYSVFTFVDNLVPFSRFPGVGIIIIITIITLFGFLGQMFITRPIKIFIEKLILKTPLIKIIYTSIKDLMSAFVGSEKKFKNPVLVKVNSVSELEKIGFLTQENLSDIGVEGKKVAVYFPHSYAFSGELFIVPAENVRSLDAKSTDIMKFIVSGGVSKL